MKSPNFFLNRILPSRSMPAPPVVPPALKQPRAYHSRRHNPDAVYVFLLQFKAQHDGASPGLREIMDACDISSTSVVANILDRLARQQRIEIISRGRALRIRIPGARWVPPPAA